jgi:predicted CopG family antitoxin
MTKKLTITIDDDVYEGLYRRIGPRKISRFLESLARPHVLDEELEASYRDMAADEAREAEAEEWSDNLASEVADETR